MPPYIEPMLATLATKAFSDPDWLFEIKWDGFRVQAVVDDGKVKIWTRNLNDAETYFPRLLTPPRWIEAEQAIVDGEVVALDEDGRPDFSLLQTKLGEQGRRRASSTRPSTCSTSTAGRCSTSRSRTASGCSRACSGSTRGSASPPTSWARAMAFFEAARGQAARGHHRQAPPLAYEPGRRSPAWLKIKIRPEQELVVGGWTPGEGNARDLGALAVGVLRGRQAALRRQGRLGLHRRDRARSCSRAAQAARRSTTRRSTRRRRKDYRAAGAASSGASRWVKPELVIRAELGGWTRDGIVRQAAFKGFEPGRDPTTVHRESAGRHGRRGPCRRGGGAGAARSRRSRAELGGRTAERAEGAERRQGVPAPKTRRRPRHRPSPRRLARHRRRARRARRARQGRRLAGRRRTSSS